MKNLVILLVFFGVAFTYVYCQNCSTITAGKQLMLQDNFNLTKYAGAWYEVRSNKTAAGPHEADCIRTNYTTINVTKDILQVTLLEARDHYKVKKEGVGRLNFTNVGEVTIANLTMSNTSISNGTYYWILKTDYNYSLIYSCHDVAQKGEEYVLVYSRNKTLGTDSLHQINEELKKYSPLETKFTVINQTEACDKLYAGSGSTLSQSGLVLGIHVLAAIVFTKLF